MDAGQGVRAKSGEAGTGSGPMEGVKSGEVEPLRSDSLPESPPPSSLPPSLPPSRSLSFPPLSSSPSLCLSLSLYTHTLSLYSISFVLMRTVSRIAKPGQEFLNAHQNLAVLLDESP